MPRRPPPREVPELDCDMRPDDIAAELRQLNFDRTQFNAIRIDADVRDFLVDALSARHVSRRD